MILLTIVKKFFHFLPIIPFNFPFAQCISSFPDLHVSFNFYKPFSTFPFLASFSLFLFSFFFTKFSSLFSSSCSSTCSLFGASISLFYQLFILISLSPYIRFISFTDFLLFVFQHTLRHFSQHFHLYCRAHLVLPFYFTYNICDIVSSPLYISFSFLPRFLFFFFCKCLPSTFLCYRIYISLSLFPIVRPISA